MRREKKEERKRRNQSNGHALLEHGAKVHPGATLTESTLEKREEKSEHVLRATK